MRCAAIDCFRSLPSVTLSVNQVAAVLPSVAPFNSVLVNCYPNGSASIKWHADDESCYGDAHTSTIASVSFGARRTFCLRRRLQGTDGKTCQLLRKIALPSGSLLVMCGGEFHFLCHWLPSPRRSDSSHCSAAATQAFWQHSLPPDTSLHAKRINLTFRHVFFEAVMRHHHSTKTLDLLEQSALSLLRGACLDHAAHVCCFGVGDCIILHLLSRLCDSESAEEGGSAGMQEQDSAGQGGGLARGCRILVIDSLHLLQETLPFLEQLQARYGARLHFVVMRPDGCTSRQQLEQRFGQALFHKSPRRYREVRMA